MKKVVLTGAAAKQMRKLDPVVAERIRAKLDAYAGGESADVTAYKSLENGFRLRVGTWRAVFVETDAEIIVRLVGHRRDVYD